MMLYVLYMIYWDRKLMCLAWAWCDICLIGLANIYTYSHEIDVHENSKSGWRNMVKVRVGRNPMTFIGSIHGGASPNGRNSVDPPRESSWWCHT